ncbi:MAG: 3-isopropylmalate dehydratase small subunit [Opitutae bacterium]|nr:3-isopropylmalate dehydratase small subunit [Opitutae bacterium]
MNENSITKIEGRAVFVPGDDVDTDRIIPARFMKCITFDGLGEFLFYDVRYKEDGSKKEHNLNDERFSEATIIVGGNNFGCGSSREHAPQSIQKAGFNAVIAGSFAEIFFGNSTNLGVVCVVVGDDDRKQIADLIDKQPELVVSIDLEALKVNIGEYSFDCLIKQDARKSLLEGSFDALSELLEGNSEVDTVVSGLHYIND